MHKVKYKIEKEVIILDNMIELSSKIDLEPGTCQSHKTLTICCDCSREAMMKFSVL
jgi:hypothetical protein